MNIEEKIKELNARAQELWVKGDDQLNTVVAISIFIDSVFVQAWFSIWDISGVIENFYQDFIAEDSNLEGSLIILEKYLSKFEVENSKNDIYYFNEGDKIANANGFTD